MGRPWFDQLALPAGEHDLEEADLEQGAQGRRAGALVSVSRIWTKVVVVKLQRRE